MTDPKTSPELTAEAEQEAQTEDATGTEPDSEEVAETLAKLHKMTAPHKFADSVEETIRKRSAGRFFGRKAFGDRIPFEILAIIALILGLAVFVLLRASQTGSLRYDKPQEKPTIAPGAKDVVPQPAPVDN